MGKHDSGYERVERDFYATPHKVTQAVLTAELFTSADRIWDPARGEGHIVKAAIDLGLHAFGSDIKPHCPTARSIDFLTAKMPETATRPDIVTNPPYGVQGRLAVKFIEHALKLTMPHRKRVIMLLPVGFDSGKTRKHLFDHCSAFQREYVLTDRIRWANLEQKKAGPKENHSWFVWSWDHLPGGPRKRYLHNTKD